MELYEFEMCGRLFQVEAGYYASPRQVMWALERESGWAIKNLADSLDHELIRFGRRELGLEFRLLMGAAWNSQYYCVRDAVRAYPASKRPCCVVCGRRLGIRRAIAWEWRRHSSYGGWRTEHAEPICAEPMASRWARLMKLSSASGRCQKKYENRLRSKKRYQESKHHKEAICLEQGRKLLREARRIVREGASPAV
jgi:hypothetical protein